MIPPAATKLPNRTSVEMLMSGSWPLDRWAGFATGAYTGF
jgi:hypothetical protein